MVERERKGEVVIDIQKEMKRNETSSKVLNFQASFLSAIVKYSCVSL